MLPLCKETNDTASNKNIKQLLLNTRSGLLRADDFIMKHTYRVKVNQLCSSKDDTSMLETSITTQASG